MAKYLPILNQVAIFNPWVSLRRYQLIPVDKAVNEKRTILPLLTKNFVKNA
jgi:hypothetical protein